LGNQLGEFLRAHRDLVGPDQVGLPHDDARRVRGLRREEVALLANLSTDYYIRLEQGREKRPSEQVLDAIARALLLDEATTAYLFQVAQPTSHATRTAAQEDVDERLQQLMDHYLSVPACVLGPASDILAANQPARALYSGFARFDNLLHLIFLDPFAPEFYLDWDEVASHAVGNLRAQAGRLPDDPAIKQAVNELSMHSPAFARMRARQEVRPRGTEDKRLRHPRVGRLDLHYQAFTVVGAPGQRLFIYSAPPHSAAADALALLTSTTSPPQDAVKPTGTDHEAAR